MSSDQTDQDPQITDHPFESIGRWRDTCEWVDADGWICGYAEADHPGNDPEQRP